MKYFYFCRGEMAERSIAAVLKTVEGNTSGGSNPSFSAKNYNPAQQRDFSFGEVSEWSNVTDSKSVVLSSVPGVRIPPSPHS